MNDDYDVIIIGTGAGGGTLAHRLAPSGLRILLLERGDYIKRELENWDSREVITKGRYKAKEKWFDKTGQQFHPGQHVPLPLRPRAALPRDRLGPRGIPQFQVRPGQRRQKADGT